MAFDEPRARPTFADPVKHVIVDTDPGIDDAAALLLLSASPGVELHSLTTVFGNGPIDLVTRNARYIVERFGLDLPVLAGADRPMVGERFVPPLKVHGEDALGDSGLAADPPPLPQEAPAWRHIVESVRAKPGQLSLLALGPLTNLALALRHDPGIVDRVREVVVMGGAFGGQGRRGNISPRAEANFFYDAHAADAVLAARWPVTVVNLDVSTDCVLTTVDAGALADQAPDVGGFLWQISRRYEEIYRRFDGIEGFCLHDVAAAAFLIMPELFETIDAQVTVGKRSADRGHSRLVASARDARRRQAVCRAVDGDAVIAAFKAALLGMEERRMSLRAATGPLV